MKQLELGTYVDCSKLTLEQVGKLLEKWVELVGGDCDDFEEDLSNLDEEFHYLVYCESYAGCPIMWFWDNSYNADTEVFYEDFFPEELEGVQPTPVKRVKTIDLERKTQTITLDENYIVKSGQAVETSLPEFCKGLENIVQDARVNHYGSALEFIGEPRVVITENNIKVVQDAYIESKEAFEYRVSREKDLNDMYNADISQLKKKLLHVQQDLDDISSIINTAKAMDHQKLEQIKKILED